jgi:dihydropyrimidinase
VQFRDERHHEGRTSFRWAPNGIPGVGARLPVLFSEGVGKGRIDLNRFVALSATSHARTCGPYPRKGAIAVGSDAGIAIWDPGPNRTITNESQQHGADYTPYGGIEVTGWPVLTMVRGKTVMRDGAPAGAGQHGVHLSRSASPLAAGRRCGRQLR